MLHSIYDLTTSCRKTSGDVPAKLVGASTTVVGSKMYLFGGRLVTERRMVSDLYMFDLETLVWERLPSFPEDDVPRPRYFHSADAWNNHLIVFGGMSNQPTTQNPDELCVLNDVRLFNLATRRWLPASQTSFLNPDDPVSPRARYAHLSSISADRLFVIGGQDFYNTWLDDVCVYDLRQRRWTQRTPYPRHCGTYRSVAVSSNYVVRTDQDSQSRSQTAIGPPGSRFRDPKAPPTSPSREFTKTESMVHMPYSAQPTDAIPADIYLYSNYNFTDVKRELEVFSPVPGNDFDIQDRSASMTGTTFPPGLRFPTGAILGSHLIIAGTYLAHSYQSFSIWVLDTNTMSWSRVDPGKAVETGSWFRSCLWVEANKLMIFGNKDGNLVEDYNRRLLSWDHVAIVDLEAFGIYQPPMQKFDPHMQELGLAALEESVLADFEIICDDGRSIQCSRKTLEERWPWFKIQRKRMLEKALQTVEQLPSSPMDVPLPELPGSVSNESRPDPRLTPRALNLSEPYPITMALLQYFYSQSLVTSLQHAPPVLSQLLVLASNYDIPHLASLVKHAMHRALSNATSVGVYEVATLCSCRSLQIRALKTVMSYTQKKPSRSRNEKDGRDGGATGGSGSSYDGPGGGGSSSGGGGSKNQPVTRPRGTSDARWHQIGDSGNVPQQSFNLELELEKLAIEQEEEQQRQMLLSPVSPISPVTPISPAHLSPPIHPLTPPDSPRDGPPSELPSFPRPRQNSTRHAVRPVSIGTEHDMLSIVDSVSTRVVSPTTSTFPKIQTHARAQSDDLDEMGLDPAMTARQPYSESEAEGNSLFYRSSTTSSSRYYGDSDSEYEHISSPSVDSRHFPYVDARPNLLSRRQPRAYPSPVSPNLEHRYAMFPDKSDTPSLVSSSVSTRSSMSSHYASPQTPSIGHFPSELGIIQEQHGGYEEDDRTEQILLHRRDENMMSSKSKVQSPTISLTPSRTMSVDTALSASSYEASTILPLSPSPSRSTFSKVFTPSKSKSPSLPKTKTPSLLSLGQSGSGSKGSALDLSRSSSGSSTLDSSNKSIKSELKKQKKEEGKARKEDLAAKFAQKREQEAAAKAADKQIKKKPKAHVPSMWGDPQAITM